MRTHSKAGKEPAVPSEPGKSAKEERIYAVLTGDIVGSSRTLEMRRKYLLDAMKSSFEIVTRLSPSAIAASFEIYRGDSFQGVLSRPETALRTAIALRAALRRFLKGALHRHTQDARIAIGIGTVDYLAAQKASEGDGDAYRRSGPLLDAMKGNRRLRISTPWPRIDEELGVSCSLLDALIERWSSEQAEAMLGLLQGRTQEAIAQDLGISQPAVVQRLKAAGGWAVEAFCIRYELLIREAIERGIPQSGA
jgi:class 3 adenylate cyclase